MTDDEKRALTRLGILLFELNHLVDAGRSSELPIEELQEAASAGKGFALVKERFGRVIDQSVWNPEALAKIEDQWQGFADAIDAERKFGVSKSGLSLAIAFTTQSILHLLPD